MNNPKRIIDILIFMLALTVGVEAGAKSLAEEGYARVFFKTQALGANATTSIQITEPVSRWSIYLNQSASFTFNSGAGVGFQNASSSYWYVFTGSRTLELVPQELSDNTYIWIKNGATAQTLKFYSLGK